MSEFIKKYILQIFISIVIAIAFWAFLYVGKLWAVSFLSVLIVMFAWGAKAYYLKSFIPKKFQSNTESIAFIFYALFINFMGSFYIIVFYDVGSLNSFLNSWIYVFLALISLHIASSKYLIEDDKSSNYIYDLVYSLSAGFFAGTVSAYIQFDDRVASLRQGIELERLKDVEKVIPDFDTHILPMLEIDLYWLIFTTGVFIILSLVAVYYSKKWELEDSDKALKIIDKKIELLNNNLEELNIQKSDLMQKDFKSESEG